MTGSDAERADGLTHLDESGYARMVDVGGKAASARTATATAVLRTTPETAARLAAGDLPKGDALPVARIAGIQAAKRTPELIPLCHQVALSGVDVDVRVDAQAGETTVTATARTVDRTGVEMEAMVAASVAGLALYDMIKAVERGAVLGQVALQAKSGGVRGDYRRQDSATGTPYAGIHHVLLAMPPGAEDEARAFYGGVLGLVEVEKPSTLAGRGGAWFRGGALELHLGVEDPFRPMRKPHPGILVADLDQVAARLAAAGAEVRVDHELPGYRRFYADDCFGNRLELLTPAGTQEGNR